MRKEDVVKNILIVDDEAFARDAIVESITWENYDIAAWSASNGREALCKLSELEIDLVITDIKMPGMDGLELVRKVKECSPETGVLMLSSYNEFELVRTAMRLGAMDYLFKPTMMPDSILSAVLQALEKQQSANRGKQRERMLRKQKDDLVGEAFFQKLMQEEADAEELREQLRRRGLNSVQNVYIIHFTAAAYQQSLKKVFVDKTDVMKKSVENVIIESIEKRFYHCMAKSNFREYIVVLWSAEKLGKEDIRQRITALIYECLGFLKSYYRIEFEVGISGERADMLQLNVQCVEAEEAVRRADLNYLPVCWYSGNNSILTRELASALDFIRDNLGNKKLSLAMVAKHIGISKNYFSKLFKETMQINFIEYVTKMRLETAKKLYLSTDMKIYEIADKVGYSDWHYLYALYKKNYGHSLSREKRIPQEQ